MNDIKNYINAIYKKSSYLNLCAQRNKFNQDRVLYEISQIILLADSVQKAIKRIDKK